MAGTALVTGASSGIGEAFARALARRGHDLVLVARRSDRLEALAEQVGVEARVLAADLLADARTLKPRVDELGVEVELLVNNAGFGTHGRFLDQDPGRDCDQVRLNCEAVVALTHAFLPGMVDRRRGGVITVASTAGMQPLPYQSVYSATKAFALTFTEALHAELRGTGVGAMAVNPGPVPTEWQAIAGFTDQADRLPKALFVSAEEVAAQSLRAFDRGRRSFVPGTWMRAFMRANGPAPRGLKLRVSERMYRPRDRD